MQNLSRHLNAVSINIIALIIALLVLGSHTTISNPVYRYQFSSNLHSKPTDSIQFLQVEKRTVFQIIHAFGIGAATISLTSGQWPKDIVLRFLYDNTHGFSMLENLEITTTRFQLLGNTLTSGKMPFRLPDSTGNFNQGDAFAGEMKVLIEKRNGAMEVTLPANVFTGSTTVKLAWIDAYRR